MLAQRAAKGDEAALRELVERYHHKMTHRIISIVKDENVIDDIIQDVRIALWRGIGSFRNGSRFSTWLYRLVTNCALTHYRRIRTHRASPMFAVEQLTDLIPYDRTNAERDIDAKKLIRRLDTILATSKTKGAAEQRTAYLLSAMGFSHPESAAITGYSLPAIKSQLHRARLRVDAKLTQEEKRVVNF